MKKRTGYSSTYMSVNICFFLIYDIVNDEINLISNVYPGVLPILTVTWNMLNVFEYVYLKF